MRAWIQAPYFNNPRVLPLPGGQVCANPHTRGTSAHSYKLQENRKNGLDRLLDHSLCSQPICPRRSDHHPYKLPATESPWQGPFSHPPSLDDRAAGSGPRRAISSSVAKAVTGQVIGFGFQ